MKLSMQFMEERYENYLKEKEQSGHKVDEAYLARLEERLRLASRDILANPNMSFDGIGSGGAHPDLWAPSDPILEGVSLLDAEDGDIPEGSIIYAYDHYGEKYQSGTYVPMETTESVDLFDTQAVDKI